MSPYLAIIRDSFRAALSSRVLWIAFVAIWLFLALLAPIGYHEDYTSTISWSDFDNGTQLKAMLARGLVDPTEAENPIGRLAAAMPNSLKRQLENVGKGDQRIFSRDLAEGLNTAIEDESWYDAEAWSKTARLKELRDLDELNQDEIADSLRKRRARLRIEAAFPGVFVARPARSITLSYAGYDFPAFFSLGKEQFVLVANQFVMPILMDWLLGFVLIFLGILVTSAIVPDMLQPGSLHLLLSKPVSRTLLLISKFVGGCAFVFLCVCQLVIGLWLIAGLRLDIWNIRLLWCIPVAVFLFSVFFSVSVFAGLRWRSPILAIGVTCIFGAFLLIFGIVGSYFDDFVRRPATIRNLIVADGKTIAITKDNELVEFDESENTWTKLIKTDASRSNDLLLPLVAYGKDHVLTARVRGGRFNPYGIGPPDLLMLNKDNDWKPEPSLRLPPATRKILVSEGSLLAMNSSGLMMADGDILTPQEAEESPGLLDQIASLIKIQGQAVDGFRSILPRDVSVIKPARSLVLNDGKAIVIYSRGRIFLLQPDEDATKPWKVTKRRDLDGDPSKPVKIAASGSVLLVVRNELPILLLDSETLQTKCEIEDPPEYSIVSAIGIGDQEKFVLVSAEGSCELIDMTSRQTDWLGLDEVETVHWDAASDQILIAHNVDRISFLDSKSYEQVREQVPAATGWRAVDRYGLTPLRAIIPQTGELGETVATLVSGKSAVAIAQGNTSGGEVIRRNVLRPVLSCAIFICFAMFVSCVYFSRKDF